MGCGKPRPEMFKELRELFVLTRQEKSGILMLLSLILFLIAIDLSLPYIVPRHVVDTSDWEQEVERFYAESKQDPNRLMPSVQEQVEPFDPNKGSLELYIKAGLPESIARNIMRYVAKGGRFMKKEDLKKIYGMTPMLYDRFTSYLVFPEAMTADRDGSGRRKDRVGQKNRYDPVNDSGYAKKSLIQPLQVELNSADSLQLLSLPGIGPVLSARIIKYRNLLGGFYSVEQLREVYGLKEENYQRAVSFLTVDQSLIKRLNVNFLSVRELGRHPYIGFQTARRVVEKRDREGRLDSLKYLAALLSEDSLSRLKPYLVFNPP